jgi:hypothetical protein
MTDSSETIPPGEYTLPTLLPQTAAAIVSEPLRKCAAWNAEHSPGCAVLVWQQLPAGSWQVVKTIGRAFVWRNRAAIYCNGFVRPIALSNLSPVPDDIVDRLELQIPRRRPDGKERAVKG